MDPRLRCLLGDLTRERVDAVVNAANSTLRGGGGVDGALHRAAGPGLLAECVARHPGGCPTGDARLTAGHDLPARWVVHAVGPVWRGGDAGEDGLLAACHRRALELAEGAGAETVSFPAISCGAYGYPHERAARVALGALSGELAARPALREVRVVLFSADLLATFQRALEQVAPPGG